MRFWLTRRAVWAIIRARGVRNFNGCLVWQGGINSKQDPYGMYGRVTFHRKGQKRSFYVHRLALWVDGRLRLNDPLQACHRCHFTLCFEPTHLEPGTVIDNLKQRDERRRRLRAVDEQHSTA